MADSAGNRAEGDPRGSSVNPQIPELETYVQAGNTTAQASKRVRFLLGDDNDMHDAHDANTTLESAVQYQPAPPTMNKPLHRPAPLARFMNPPELLTPSPYMMSFLAPVPADPTRYQPPVTPRKGRSTGRKSARKSTRVSPDTDAGQKRKRAESPSDASSEENEDLQEDTDTDSDTSYHAPVDKTNAEIRRRSSRSASAEISYVESSDDEALEKILEEHESAEKTRRPRKASPRDPVTDQTGDMNTAAETENDDGILAHADNDANALSDHGSLEDTANQTAVNDVALEHQDKKLRYKDVVHFSNVFIRPFLEQFARAIMPLLKEDSRSEFEQVLQTVNGAIPSKHDKDSATDAGSRTALQPLAVTNLQTATSISEHISAVKIHVTLYVNERELATRILSGQDVTTFIKAKTAIVDLFQHDSSFDYAAISSLNVETLRRLSDGSKKFHTVSHDQAYASWAHLHLRNLAGPKNLEMRVYIDEAIAVGNDAASGYQNEEEGREHREKADEGYRADDDNSSS